MELTVSEGAARRKPRAIEIESVDWKGLRCTVVVDGDVAGLSVDIRRQPGAAASSVVVSVKALKDNGTASVVVENEDLEGAESTLVLLDRDGRLVAQRATVIGRGTT